ncbi:ribokinase [Salinicoccus sp. ID82-1]|uniref:ribokinase n=1 Tax=Salinicoccus sp. ID82-1 TaxID=2820269 RepID=UPI0021052330|nr:ribokinase [Salinicoccus sp. ID82-1]MCG1010651.1 ribokinase [Salinicoccus sp. ID82-1]
MNPRITVIGSINMDIVTHVGELPSQGETVFGEKYFMTPGGKGANQAVASARLGGKVSFIGKIGNDSLGEKLIKNFRDHGIHTEGIDRTDGSPTGMANVILQNNDNRIIVVSGANKEVTVEYVQRYKEILLDSDIVLTQLEIPISTVEWCAEFCNKHSIPLIINPAPAQELSKSLIENCKYLTPNEEEYVKILSTSSSTEQFINKFITTLGSRGASFLENIVPAPFVKAKDTTGAGDTFNGALAYFLGAGYEINTALELSNIAASYTVEQLGAQTGMPTLEQVQNRKIPSR